MNLLSPLASKIPGSSACTVSSRSGTFSSDTGN